MEEQKIYELINENLGFYLATMDGDQPRVRGMMLFRADKNGIVFHTASTKLKCALMQMVYKSG